MCLRATITDEKQGCTLLCVLEEYLMSGAKLVCPAGRSALCASRWVKVVKHVLSVVGEEDLRSGE